MRPHRSNTAYRPLRRPQRPLSEIAAVAMRTALHTLLLGEPLSDRIGLVTAGLRAEAGRRGIGGDALRLVLEYAWESIPEAHGLSLYGVREELVDRMLRACSDEADEAASPG